MADYKEMYKILFQGTTKAISILQETQRKVEELYISSEEPNIQILQDNEIERKSIESLHKKNTKI